MLTEKLSLTMSKRKRTILSLGDKVRILEKIENGKQRKDIAEEYGIGKTTVHDIIKNKENIRRFVSSNKRYKLESRCLMREAQLEGLEKRLYDWFLEKRTLNVPISGPLLTEKAKALYKEMIDSKVTFKFSHGWVERFKHRYGLHHIKLVGEQASADYEAANEFKRTFMDIITRENLDAEQVSITALYVF